MSSAPHTWPRLFVADPLAEGSFLTLSSDQSRYIVQVMRLREGESVRLFNGQDGEWRASLSEMPKGKKTGAVLHIEHALRAQTPESDIWLCAAPIKRNHFDFMIMKATELGVSLIQPVLTDRAQIRDVNVERCRAIAIEAAEQSERLSVPTIGNPLSVDRLVKGWPEKRLAILCAEFGEAQPAAQALCGGLARARAQAAIITGPEGGFTKEDMEKLNKLPERLSIRLGPRILRADTAALAALSCWQALCGDWQNRDWPNRES